MKIPNIHWVTGYGDSKYGLTYDKQKYPKSLIVENTKLGKWYLVDIVLNKKVIGKCESCELDQTMIFDFDLKLVEFKITFNNSNQFRYLCEYKEFSDPESIYKEMLKTKTSESAPKIVESVPKTDSSPTGKKDTKKTE